MSRIIVSLSVFAICATTQANADDLFTDDVIIQDDLLCIGNQCSNGETEVTSRTAIKLKGFQNGILFDDTTITSGFSATDWQITVNGANDFEEFFAIEDMTDGTRPVLVEGGAPSSTLYLNSVGNVGLGTFLPGADLHIAGASPTIRFDPIVSGSAFDLATASDGFIVVDRSASKIPFNIKPGSITDALVIAEDGDIGMGTGTPARELHIVASTPTLRLEDPDDDITYDIGQDDGGFYVYHQQTDSFPIQAKPDAPTASFVIDSQGSIGLGTSFPEAPLELSSDESFNFFRITAEGAPNNESVDFVFTQGPLTTGQLRYNIVDGDGPEMTLDANGNMLLTGTLSTAGPSCTGGCDRVFDAEYALPSITAYAAEMYRAGYLPAVGPTLPHVPVNMSEQMGGMLNTLEHAMIYIDRLNTDLEAEHARNDALAAQLAQLSLQMQQIAQN